MADPARLVILPRLPREPDGSRVRTAALALGETFMGINVAVRAPVPRAGLRRRPLAPEEIHERIASSLRAQITDPMLARFIRTETHGRALLVLLNPLAEPIEIKVEGGEIVASAKTSTIGPGYHVWLVDLLDAVAADLSVRWRREDQGDADYGTHRNVEALQREMSVVLRAIAKRVLPALASGEQSIRMNLPVGQTFPSMPGNVLTPSGPFPVDFWRRVARAEGERLTDLADDFYIWWEPGLHPAFWARMCVGLMWTSVPWRIPMVEHELQASLAAQACAERANARGPHPGIPPAEQAELNELLKGAASSAWREPAPDRIGYRRRPMRMPLPGGWSVDAPGYFVHEVQDDGGTHVVWFGDRVARFTTFTVKRRDPRAKHEPPPPKPEERAGGEFITFESPNHAGWAIIKPDAEAKNARGTLCHATVAAPDAIAVATITYTDPGHRAWAERTVRSLVRRADGA